MFMRRVEMVVEQAILILACSQWICIKLNMAHIFWGGGTKEQRSRGAGEIG
jgi:hypothetical protein